MSNYTPKDKPSHEPPPRTHRRLCPLALILLLPLQCGCHGPATVEAQVEASAYADQAPNWDPRFGVHVPPPAPTVSYDTRRAGYRDYRIYWEVWRLEDGTPVQMLGYADHQGQVRELIERDKAKDTACKAACDCDRGACMGGMGGKCGFLDRRPR